MAARRRTFKEFAALTDGSVELRLRDVLARLPAYQFTIHRCGAAPELGRVLLRLGADPTIALYAGNIGYAIEPAHRGHHHAARACRLLRPVALFHGVDALWIVTAPDNLASRRTAGLAGGEYVDTREMPPDTDMYAEGMRQARRYRLAL